MFRAIRVVLIVAFCGLAQSAAAEPRLEVDVFSFFFFEGANQGEGLPANIAVPIALQQVSADVWQTSIAATDLAMPPVAYPSGLRVTWRLSSTARGTLTRTGGSWKWTIAAPLVAYVEDAPTGVEFPLDFTTEQASVTARGETASREGVALDPSSGYVQLVAVGVSPEGAPTAPGKPFYAVLSGRLLGLPVALASP